MGGRAGLQHVQARRRGRSLDTGGAGALDTGRQAQAGVWVVEGAVLSASTSCITTAIRPAMYVHALRTLRWRGVAGR